MKYFTKGGEIMIKRILVFSVLVLMLMVGSVGYASAVSGEDAVMPNMSGLEITKEISINEAGKYLGDFQSVQYYVRETGYGAHAFFEYGEIWIESVKDMAATGKITQVIVSKPQFITNRGIFMGEDIQKVINVYGQPDKIVNDQKETKRYVYSIKKDAKMKMMRIVFHAKKDGQIDYIMYSRLLSEI